jgi:hypothetical protein
MSDHGSKPENEHMQSTPKGLEIPVPERRDVLGLLRNYA